MAFNGLIGKHPGAASEKQEFLSVYLETGDGTNIFLRQDWLGETIEIENGLNQRAIPTARIGITLGWSFGSPRLDTRDWQVDIQGSIRNIWDTLLKGRRIQVRTDRNNQNNLLLFDGFTRKLDINWNHASTKTIRSAQLYCEGIFSAANSQKRNIFGQYRKSGFISHMTATQAPATNKLILVEPLQTIFNPDGLPNCNPNPINVSDPISGETIHVYVFSDEQKQLDNDDNIVSIGIRSRSIYWNYARALTYVWFAATQAFRDPLSQDQLNASALHRTIDDWNAQFVPTTFGQWTQYNLQTGNLYNLVCDTVDADILPTDNPNTYIDEPKVYKKIMRTKPYNLSVHCCSPMEAFLKLCSRAGIFFECQDWMRGGLDYHRLKFIVPAGTGSASSGGVSAGTDLSTNNVGLIIPGAAQEGTN